MARRSVASLRSLLCALVLVAGAGEALAQVPAKPPMPPPRPPPLRYLPSTHDAAATSRLDCADCSGDQAPTLVLDRDGVTVRVSARPTATPDGAQASGKATVNVTIQTRQPSEISAGQDYITLRNKDDNRDYLLSPSDYKMGIFNLEDMPETPEPQTVWIDHASGPPPSDDWPTGSNITENSLDFMISADVLSGSFSVQLPEILINGKGYTLPPIEFDPQQP
ncbi:MAG TPA: hypothetical protein VGO34_11060 [Alphaproteobacteria bacterium]|jgi:hypothetical protein